MYELHSFSPGDYLVGNCPLVVDPVGAEPVCPPQRRLSARHPRPVVERHHRPRLHRPLHEEAAVRLQQRALAHLDVLVLVGVPKVARRLGGRQVGRVGLLEPSDGRFMLIQNPYMNRSQ